jgi:predicted glycosyltransferase
MKVWFDCTAAAHPLVLRPVIEAFRDRGDEVLVTAREYGQTVGLLEMHGIPHLVVGSHGGASRLGKALSLASRSFSLIGPVRRFGPDLAVGHGSVDLAIVSKLLGIPSVQLQDYEFAGLQRQLAFRAASRVLVPDSIPVNRMTRVGAGPDKLVRYPGLKEDYYLADFEPDPAVLDLLGIDPGRVLAIVRPPPETSEYHEDNPVHEAVMSLLAGAEGVTCVFIPRTDRQAEEARAMGSDNLIVPREAVDAQSLIAFADLVISAGGTMNREAVALGTPVYSTFAGRLGGVDEALIADGRLQVLDDPGAVSLVKKRSSGNQGGTGDPSVLVEGILGALD